MVINLINFRDMYSPKNMEFTFETIKNLITDTIAPLSQRIQQLENTINQMTITGKTTIHYTDDEDSHIDQSEESVEEEPIQLIDFGPEIDDLRERAVIFEAEIREKIEEAERKQLAKI